MLVLDGVVEPLGEHVRFRTVAAPSEPQLQALLARLIARMVRRLTKDGWLSQNTEPPSLDLEPRDVLDELAAASIRYRIADGPGAGQRTLTLRSPSLARPATPKALNADLQGFSLPFSISGAAVACSAVQRNRLERLARYVARPAIAHERLAVDPAGRVVLLLAGGLDDAPRHPRAQTPCASHPVPLPGMGRLRAQLSTSPACGPVTPRHRCPQVSAAQGVVAPRRL